MRSDREMSIIYDEATTKDIDELIRMRMTFRLLMKDIQYMPRLVLRINSTDTGTCVISFDSSL